MGSVLTLLSVIFIAHVPAVDDGSETHDGEEEESSTNGGSYERENYVCLCLLVRASWERRVTVMLELDWISL